MSDDWKELQVGDFCEVSAGGTPDTSNKEYWEDGTIPWMTSGEVHKQRIKETDSRITPLGLQNSSAKFFPKDSVLVALAGQGKTRGKVAISEIELTTNQSIAAIIATKDICDPEFLYYNLSSRYEELRSLSGGSGRAGLNLSILSAIEIRLPPLPEQKKIAEILSGVDNLIKCEQEQLRKIQTLYESLTTRTDQFGSATDSGGFAMCNDKIPSNWKLLPYGEVLQSDMEGFTLCEREEYSPVIVRRRHSGIETRETKKGREILVKQQFKAKHGCFLISKRQAIHGSTGIVPATLARNPIISKEYGQYSSADENLLDINFMSFYSRTMLFRESVRISVYGVDIEKYVFKDSTWLKQKMLVPPLEEQREIIRLCKSLEDAIASHSSRIQRAGQIKSSLSSDLLSGRKRVSV